MSALESRTLTARSRPVEARIAEGYQGLRSIWAPEPSWCPLIWARRALPMHPRADSASAFMPTGIGGVTADLPQEEHPRDGTCWNSSRRGGDCARCVDHYRFAPRGEARRGVRRLLLSSKTVAADVTHRRTRSCLNAGVVGVSV